MSKGETNELFDSDFHLNESPSNFSGYLEEPFDKVVQRGKFDYSTSIYPEGSGIFSFSSVGKTILQNELQTKRNVIEAKEELGLDHVLVQPTLNLLLACIEHEELAAALASAYNAWVQDKIVDKGQGIYASVLVAPQLPRQAASEIKRYAEEKEFIAVMIPSGGCTPALGNRRYYPLYEACERAGLPITMHNVADAMMYRQNQIHGFNRALTNHAIAHPMQHMIHLSDIIFQGIPERYPDLNIVMQEAGLGWAAFMMRRLDSEYLNRREDASMLQKMPSKYIEDQFHFSTQPIEGNNDLEYVWTMLELIGIDNVMFSSDYPHFDFDHTEDFVSTIQGLDSDDIARICSENAKALFDI